MSDKWEIKSVTKSGDGFNIRIGPKSNDEGLLGAIAAIVLALSTMSLFDLSGWGWGITLVLTFAVLSVMFPIPAGICVIAIITWIVIKPESDSQRPNMSKNQKLAESVSVDADRQIQKMRPTDKSYGEYRTQYLFGPWNPYLRDDVLQNWSPPYPEVLYCIEDNCVGHFINESTGEVKEVYYSICTADRYVQCSGKPNGYEQVDREIVWSKTESDNNWARTRRNLN